MKKDMRILDLSNPQVNRMAREFIKNAKGPHYFSVTKARPHRTLSQNNFWWAAVVPAIRRGLEDAWGEKLSDEQAHEFLKAQFLSQPVVNRETGEQIGLLPGSTATLTTEEFGELIDKVAVWAGEYLKTEVPMPGMRIGA